MFRSIGLPEILIVLAVLLLLFGATRLPQVGKSLGSSMRAFKRAVTGEDETEPAQNEPAKKEKETAGKSTET